MLGVSALEVAVLDRARPRRTFRRIAGPALRGLLPEANQAVDAPPSRRTPQVATTPPRGRAPPNESTGPLALENNLSGVSPRSNPAGVHLER